MSVSRSSKKEKSVSHISNKGAPAPFFSSLRILVALGAVSVVFLTRHFTRQAKDTYTVCSESRNIYTVDPENPRVNCIHIRNGHVVATGTHEDVQVHEKQRTGWWDIIRPAPRIIHVDPSAVVVPGLADAHAHILENGWMQQLPLAGCASVQDVIERIKEYLRAHPDVANDPTRWIEGMGWDQTLWPGGQFPSAADLASDPLLVGRPIALNRVDGHARWVSPTVLDLMKIPPDSEIEGGTIIRDERGQPTGIFIDNAMTLIPTPPWGPAQLEEYFESTVRTALSFGLTTIHDAGMELEQVEFLQKKAAKSGLPIRLYIMGHGASEEYWGDRVKRLVNYGLNGRLTMRSIKLVSDGALGSWGAALLEPYSDRPDELGKMLLASDRLRTLVRRFHHDGWQVNVHCIGDRANHEVLDIFEEIIREGENVTAWRPRIEHAQIISEPDLERIAKLGVIASVQPTHATSDMRYAELRLGPKRIKGAYAYQTLLRASPVNVLPLGSDFPVEGVNPLLGFYAAVTRLAPDGWSPHGAGGWYPEEKLTRAEALKGMTLDAAYASFAEKSIGSLQPGKRADFVVFDKDIMTIPDAEILITKVLATVLDGEVAYGTL